MKLLEEKLVSDKKLGIIIIIVAIILMVLAVCTNFFADFSGFGPATYTSGEIKNSEELYKKEQEEKAKQNKEQEDNKPEEVEVEEIIVSDSGEVTIVISGGKVSNSPSGE
jgi:flagellar basal body-associated protein FliL